ncbi:MAG: hypothetical protein JYX80_11805 [Candidatus Scalindua sediminis]|nr:hypothetical protein [Candidatus Scalindua sediminis]HDY67646.1 hypothetical protein [Candidatus Scalindua sp.]
MLDCYYKLGNEEKGLQKILKVSRTIADLDHSNNVRIEHLSEAIQYRSL